MMALGVVVVITLANVTHRRCGMRNANVNVMFGRAFLSTINTNFKNKLSIIGIAIFMAVSLVSAFSPAAHATASAEPEYAVAGTVEPNGTVPNRFECSETTQRCWQVNGPYVSGLPHACRYIPFSLKIGPYLVSQCHPLLWW